MNLNKQPAWLALSAQQQRMAQIKIADLFQQDPQRFSKFSLSLDDLLLDYSKHNIDAQAMQTLLQFAEASELSQARKSLFSGEIVNQTEQRPALHTELRNPNTAHKEITQVLAQIAEFVADITSGGYTDVIVLGIGGSDLGPRLVCEALSPYRVNSINLHFVANVDPDTISQVLKKLNPAHTVCLVNSKTFTTIETLANANLVKAWLGKHASTQMWAATASPAAAAEWGIKATQIFKFWDWVGGRYSLWSAVGVAIALMIGITNFQKLLAGAHAMDQHFYQAPLAQNMPVILALIGIWNINFNCYPTLAVIPYADGLQLLPAYLQQLEMESNGKSVNNAGEHIDYQTAPVIWGGVGCNAQHAYMQLLHQGTQVVPVDFLLARQSHNGPSELQELLIASCLGQSRALMLGCDDAKSYKVCHGNRPSTTLLFDKLTPEIVGKLIALYEHKVFVQGVLWQIQSFDQWGVQLGKVLIKDILQVMHAKDYAQLDSSTAGLLSS
jgi:glucose-6-phosphate isomerase